MQADLCGMRLLHVLRGLLLISFAAPVQLGPEPFSDEEENNVALKFTNREVDGVAVVALDGRIVLGEESNALREKVKSLVAEGKKKIVLNMDNVTFIDSAGSAPWWPPITAPSRKARLSNCATWAANFRKCCRSPSC